MDVLLPLVASLALTAALLRREGVSPVAALMGLWLLLLVARALNPLGLTAVSFEASIIVTIGLLATAAPTFLPARPVLAAKNPHRGVARTNVIILASLFALVVAVGTIAFRSQIAASSASSFGDLSLEEIRRAQTGVAQGGGLVGLLSAANPILACLGVFGGLKFHKGFWALTAIALAATLQNPGRLIVISLIVQTAAFYLYIRPPRESAMFRSRRGGILVVGAAGVAAVGIFNEIGARLGKGQAAATYFTNYPWPEWTLSPNLYFTGGMSALSVAERTGSDPQEFGGSVYTVMRAGELVSTRFSSPDTIGSFVPIPIDFNNYTGFGVMWFDFGFLGVVALSGLLGWFSVITHRRARAGHLASAWMSAVAASVLFTLPQSYRLFFLDVVFQIVVGGIAFWLIAASTKRRETIDYRSTMTPGRTSSTT